MKKLHSLTYSYNLSKGLSNANRVNIIVCFRGVLATGTLCNRRTCFTVVSSISRFTVTAITSWKVDTGSSVLVWIFHTFVNICKEFDKKYIYIEKVFAVFSSLQIKEKIKPIPI